MVLIALMQFLVLTEQKDKVGTCYLLGPLLPTNRRVNLVLRKHFPSIHFSLLIDNTAESLVLYLISSVFITIEGTSTTFLHHFLQTGFRSKH